MTLKEAIAELRGRNQLVPKPLALPTADDVERAERTLGARFHPDYRQFLLEAGDVVYGTLEPAQVVPDAGAYSLVTMARGAWDLGVSRTLLPICEDNGDYYCMDPTGRIVFWSHDGATSESWPNLAAWIEVVWLGQG